MKYKYDPKFIVGSGMPTDRLTLNAWCRNFAATESIVNETIDFYSTYPCKFLQTKYTRNKSVNTFFKNQINKIELIDRLPEIIKDYWTLGECFIYSELDETLGAWCKLIIQNPDYIILNNSVLDDVQIFLRPDERLRTLVLKTEHSFEESKQLEKLGKNMIENIKNGKNIPLSNYYTSSFIRKQSPYELRGTSYLVPSLKSLCLLKKIRSSAEETNINIIYQQCLEHLKQEIKEALGHPDSLVKNDGAVRIEVAKMRMIHIMQMIIKWIETKIFTPISKINDFYEYKNGVKTICIPKVTFDYEKFHTSMNKL